MDLKQGQIIGNRALMDIFKCACEGGIRYSSRTETIVLVINHTKEARPNLLKDGRALFAGRPEKNADRLTGANRRLESFLEEQGKIYLFEVFKPGEYEYRGQVASAGPAQMKTAEDGRRYPVFPLRIED